jgi:hypothetical protein
VLVTHLHESAEHLLEVGDLLGQGLVRDLGDRHVMLLVQLKELEVFDLSGLL